MIIGNVFGLEEQALKLCEHRAGILSNNIANSATPNYKAVDFDFHAALKQAKAHYAVETSHDKHIQLSNSIDGQRLSYRIPMQTSIDENTVDDEIERKNFIQNSLRYQTSLSFAQNKIGILMKAIKGE